MLYQDSVSGVFVDDQVFSEQVDVAPGVDIVTPQPGGQNYPSSSGTSWAAAHVSGVAALIRDLVPLSLSWNRDFSHLLAWVESLAAGI